MRNAITWQQVAAPDFGTALQANRDMGQLVGSAFEGLSDIAGDYRTGQKDRASNQAVTQALGIDNPQEFAEAMRSGSLGINPADMNAETMSFLSQYGSQLINDQNTVAITAGNQANTASTLQNTGQDNIKFGQDQLKFGQDQDAFNRNLPRVIDGELRGDQALLDADANRAMLLEAQTEVNDLSNSTASRADAERAIYRQNLPAAQEKARLEALGQVPDGQWAVSDSITREIAGLNPVVALDQGIDNFTTGMNMAIGSDPVLRAHMQFKQEFSGITNPVKSVIDGYFEGADDGENSAEIANSRSNIITETKKLTERYKLPAEVVAGIVQEQMKGTWFDGRGQVDWGAADQILSELADPSKQNMLNSLGNTLETRQRELGEFTAESQSIQQALGKALTDGDNEAALALKADLETLRSDYAVWEKSQAPMEELMKTDEQRAAEVRAKETAARVQEANEAALKAAAEARSEEVRQNDLRIDENTVWPSVPTIPGQAPRGPTPEELMRQAGETVRNRLPGMQTKPGINLEDILDEQSLEFLFGSGR